ncbi:hypothetical protein GCM10025857_28920 [Alicyclobacillus contaminans]|uniref:cation:proton antiporter domain-containing protein n=1 Tax=Alicyclobacillus contaminans TaxID=392016 RepID=UPI0003FD798A|nr:cation:proton antiporter [Alicyclobacillus contaminans]GMA51535.1 hypothetical protein GCM10025857_28920 [Alicyclobacillus contaminans]
MVSLHPGRVVLFSVALSHIPLLRVPTAIGYLLFGVILQADPMPLPTEFMHLLSTLGAIGLYVLMFISGLEIDVTRTHVRSDSGVPLLRVALFMFCATLLLSFSASWVLVHAATVGANPWMLTLLFATSSLGVIVPVLEEAGAY